MSFQIIVVGAGASGLTAASLLAEKYSVAIVEARERSGGRIHSLKSKFPVTIEAGAEFIHGEQPLTRSLATEAKRHLSRVSGNWYQFRGGAIEEKDFFDEEWKLFIRALDRLETDTDIASLLTSQFSDAKFEGLRRKITGFVQGYDAANIHEASALALKEEWSETDDEHQYRIKGGYGALIDYLEEKFKGRGGVMMNASPVREIRWKQGSVRIVTDSGKSLDGEKVLITVPLGVLQGGAIHFLPPLADHIEAFSQIGYGGVIKFFFEFKNAFWQEPGRKMKNAAFVISDADIPTWWTQLPDEMPLLTGWIGGPLTFQTSRDPGFLFQKAMDSLIYIFGDASDGIRDQLKGWHIADWVGDPWSMGAYAFPKVGSKVARAFLLQPVRNTIYFAGEALYEGPSVGTVEAALASGREAAVKLSIH